MKVYISLPWKGKTSEEIEDNFCQAVEEVKAATNERIMILNHYYKDFPLPSFFEKNRQKMRENGKYILGQFTKNLEHLANADLVYFAEGWKKAKGCKIEHLCATTYGLNIMEYGDKEDQAAV